MANEEIMSRVEIMRAIEEGDRHAGVLMEEMSDKFTLVMESYTSLDKKIDGVDQKLEDFREEANMKFDMLFEGQGQLFAGQEQLFAGQKMLFEDNQRFFEELRAMRKESEMKFQEVFKRFDRLEGGN